MVTAAPLTAVNVPNSMSASSAPSGSTSARYTRPSLTENAEMFEAAATIETWRQHYNAVRPHSSLGYLTPNDFRAKQVKKTQSGEAVL
jgi:transposase InsO family protein